MKLASSPTTVAQRDLLTDWFLELHAPLYRYLVRLLGQCELAEDLLQDTFVRALGSLDPGNPPSNPSAWLYRIATNLAIDSLRRQRRWHWIPFVEHTNTTSFEGSVIEAQAVRSCLTQLRPHEAELLLLHEYVGLSSFEIAALTGEKASTIRVRLARIYARFRDLYLQEAGS